MKDMLQVCALPTSIGLVVVSLPRDLIRQAGLQVSLLGSVEMNGVRFEVKQSSPDTSRRET